MPDLTLSEPPKNIILQGPQFTSLDIIPAFTELQVTRTAAQGDVEYTGDI